MDNFLYIELATWEPLPIMTAMSTDSLIQPHILVVDDDARLRDLLKKYLNDHGYHVTPAASASEARGMLELVKADLIVLDVMMPGETGVAFAQKLRQADSVPILMLTALGDVENRIAGLEAGADDYLPKPFDPKELLLRVDSILRRSLERQKQARWVHFGEYRFDPQQMKLMHGDEMCHLTGSEALLLSLLAERPGEAVSRESLAQRSGGVLTSERSVDVQINRLRKKIEDNPARPVFIQTVRSAGYVLRV